MKEIDCYDLEARFDSRKSFYGKATVHEFDDGHVELRSYGTLVSQYKDGIVEHFGKWSQTTSRHQLEFERQFGKGRMPVWKTDADK